MCSVAVGWKLNLMCVFFFIFASGEARDEEDAESGNGTSLPQSPHSVEGAIGGPKSLDSDFEEPKHSVFEKK